MLYITKASRWAAVGAFPLPVRLTRPHHDGLCLREGARLSERGHDLDDEAAVFPRSHVLDEHGGAFGDLLVVDIPSEDEAFEILFGPAVNDEGSSLYCSFQELGLINQDENFCVMDLLEI